MDVSPSVAAQLAADVYAVQDNFELNVFLQHPIFSQSAGNAQSFKATVGSRLINTRDGFCVAARGGKGHKNDLFLMFRGSTTSNYGADWVSNFRIGVQSSPGGMVHVGFFHIFNSLRPDLERFIHQQGAGPANRVDNIHCIGHSLGGAVASIAASWARRSTKKNVFLYTFGAPKPGFGGFAADLTSQLGPANIHRTYHATDPVPMIPLYPFAHPPRPGYGHFRGSSNSVLSAGAHDMVEYIRSVKGLGWRAMQSVPPAVGFDKVVEKWLESDRSLNPLNADTWSWIDAGLEYVLKKILGAAAVAVQGIFVGTLSIADKIAWLLAEGIEFVVDAGKWVLLLMQKMMRILGMKVVQTIQELTRTLMRIILERIMGKITREAHKALQHLISRH
nr:lipase family protein [uncultured Desulfobacter sp.]